MYIWLSRRYESAFPDIAAAEESRTKLALVLSEAMESTLLPASPLPVLPDGDPQLILPHREDATFETDAQNRILSLMDNVVGTAQRRASISVSPVVVNLDFFYL